MSKSKYVVGLSRESRYPVAVIFPDALTHALIARAVFDDKHSVLSAGFCYYDAKAESMVPFGRSTSLDLKAREEDKFYLQQATGGLEYVPREILRADVATLELAARLAGDD
ncbi:hypothetical protein LUCX_256 [Xanthomonas phage vB_XciM_LucasX]|nr:hypothetical protein LUCX_256 [Xanthomonas phage vB_XciM_LucasX]